LCWMISSAYFAMHFFTSLSFLILLSSSIFWSWLLFFWFNFSNLSSTFMLNSEWWFDNLLSFSEHYYLNFSSKFYLILLDSLSYFKLLFFFAWFNSISFCCLYYSLLI
jgi:hypothetical protein